MSFQFWTTRLGAAAIFAAWLLAACGCNSHSFYEFMPQPAMYRGGRGDPFEQVPKALQTEYAPILYYTDRMPKEDTKRGQEYGFERCQSAAFGTMKVHFGPADMTWEQLVAESRKVPHTPGTLTSVSDIVEAGRYPDTPEPMDLSGPEPVVTKEALAAREACDRTFREMLAKQLALTPKKEVFIFIHGYHCEFEWPAMVIGQLWHYWGREGVPIAYSWPAARPGLLRGYQYDRESCDFTIHHLRHFLKLVASCPEVEKVNIISHSRGTDVACTALREISFELGGPLKAREALKLDVLVLAAADIDADVAHQRLGADRVLAIPNRFVFYVSANDSALSTSEWMFAGRRRLGMMRPNDLRGPAIQFLEKFPRVEVVDAELTLPGLFSHSYFLAHPAGSSDMILLVRDKAVAGSAARPLDRDPSGFWILRDNYLAAPTTAPSN